MIPRYVWLVVIATALVAPGRAAENSSIEGPLGKVVDWVYESDSVRISNCHIVALQIGGMVARAKCYAINKGTVPRRVRIHFIGLDRAGEPVIDTTLSPISNLESGVGEELGQNVPVTQREWGSLVGARLQAAIMPTN